VITRSSRTCEFKQNLQVGNTVTWAITLLAPTTFCIAVYADLAPTKVVAGEPKIAHGAGLMLVPIYLGLCQATNLDSGHEAAGVLINANLGMAILVSVVHALAMIVAGGFSAWLVYRYLGLKFVSRSWFNLDATWAVSLILVGALSLAIILANEH
jgi:hypothetical protein